jgi:hypothetical protein
MDFGKAGYYVEMSGRGRLFLLSFPTNEKNVLNDSDNDTASAFAST